MITVETIEKITKSINIDVSKYLNDYSYFMDNYYNLIYAYKKGDTKDKSSIGISFYDKLVNISERIEDAISSSDINLNRQDEWELIEFLDEIKIELDKVKVLDKILRVSKFSDGSSENSFQNDIIMSNNDTPESLVSKDRINADNEWVDVFTNNKLNEIDYRAGKGGVNVKFGSISNKNLFLASVVDNLQGDNVYGKDIDNEFSFSDNDIKILTPKNTIIQSAEVLLDLMKGDVPEFPSLGKSPDVAIGKNVGLINIAFLGTDIKQVFGSDDTFSNVDISNIEREADALKISVSIETFKNELIEKDLKLN